MVAICSRMRAKLSMAAQFKVAEKPKLIDQTIRDIAREGTASNLRIVCASGKREEFTLSKSTLLPMGLRGC